MKNDATTTTMSTRGRVVIPKAVRDRAGLKAGDVVTLQLVDDVGIAVRLATVQESDVSVEGDVSDSRPRHTRARARPRTRTG
jgi:AbrB family looped-hinge helix DNA binding protein